MVVEHDANLPEIGGEIVAFIDKVIEKLGSRDVVSREF